MEMRSATATVAGRSQAIAAELLESGAVLGRHGAEGVQGEVDLGAERFWRVTAVVGRGGVLAGRTAARQPQGLLYGVVQCGGLWGVVAVGVGLARFPDRLPEAPGEPRGDGGGPVRRPSFS